MKLQYEGPVHPFFAFPVSGILLPLKRAELICNEFFSIIETVLEIYEVNERKQIVSLPPYLTTDLLDD